MKIPFLGAIAVAQLFGLSVEDLTREISCMIHSESSVCKDSGGNTQQRAANQRQPDPKDQCVDVEPQFEHYYDSNSTISLEAVEKITQSGYLYRNELIALAGAEPTCRIQGSAGFTRADGSQFSALVYGWTIEDDPNRMFLVFVDPAHGDYLASFDYIPNIADWQEMSHNLGQPWELQQTIQL